MFCDQLLICKDGFLKACQMLREACVCCPEQHESQKGCVINGSMCIFFPVTGFSSQNVY